MNYVADDREFVVPWVDLEGRLMEVELREALLSAVHASSVHTEVEGGWLG